ncbi:MAG: hypothetical protein QF371_09655, partial [Flavobacteriales bacterium]|nr:hypothetical protein [Flavobacteriales bacterium]
GLTDLDLMKTVVSGPTSFLQRYGELSAQMQKFFKDWKPYDTADITDRYTDPFDLDFLKRFQEDIVEKQVDKETLARKLFENMELLEKIAAEMFRLVSNLAHGTSMDMEVDPYTMSLDPNRKVESVNSKLLERDAHVAEQMKAMWLYPYPEMEAV